MTLKDFRAFNKNDQYIVLWDRGMLVADRENDNYKYILYQLDSFYVELRLSKNDFDEQLKSFSRDRRLKPYLEAIDLRSLDVLTLDK